MNQQQANLQQRTDADPSSTSPRQPATSSSTLTWEPPCVICGKEIGYTCAIDRYVGRTKCDDCGGVADRKRLESAGLPAWFLDGKKSLETFEVMTTAAKRAVAKCRALLELDLLSRRWVLLTGRPGTGKTHLAAAAVAEFAKRKHPAIFVTFERLLLEIQDSYRSEDATSTKKIVDRYGQVYFLALDDIGVEQPSQHAIQMLYSILNERLNRQLPTVLTSNYPPMSPEPGQMTLGERLSEKLSDTTPAQRILDRLAGSATWEHLTGDSYRRMKK